MKMMLFPAIENDMVAVRSVWRHSPETKASPDKTMR